MAEDRLARPKRIQRKRTKGWKMPENAVYVGRQTKWGNPYRVGDVIDNSKPLTAVQAVARYRRLCQEWDLARPAERELLETLRGKDLACWCRLDQPCHADILLELANAD